MKTESLIMVMVFLAVPAFAQVNISGPSTGWGFF